MGGKRSGSTIFFPPVLVPETVALEGELVAWGFPRMSRAVYDDQRSSLARPTDRSLLAFTRLKDAVSVCDYAKRYGILWAIQIKADYERETDIRLTDGTVWRLGDPRVRVFAGSDPTENLQGKEPLALWFLLAQRLRAALRISAALQGRARNPLPSVGSPEDWADLGGSPPDEIRWAQNLLLREVNWWLGIGGVHLELGIVEFSEKHTEWKIDIAYEGLAGGLAYRLLLMVAGESSLYACDGCGRPHIRLKRAPRPGQENFCDDCTGVAQQRATQRYRKGKRS